MGVLGSVQVGSSLVTSDLYLAHAYNAYGECNVFTVSVLPSVHGGRVRALALFG